VVQAKQQDAGILSMSLFDAETHSRKGIAMNALRFCICAPLQ
jgi:hypothetical protein